MREVPAWEHWGMRPWRVAGVVLLVVLAGCSFFDRYPDNDLAEERLQEIETDPGFSFVPPGAELAREISYRECPPEDSDSEGLFTTRGYRTDGSPEEAYDAVVQSLRSVGWTVVRERDREGGVQEARVQRDFGGWRVQAVVSAYPDGEVEVYAGLDEEGICVPPIAEG
ncbi:MAG: hypothetical protein JNK12_13680 [Acidimicrobiales bacterium]|nr:hypothetical protein [Acidimicrobiales bacterium]